MTDKKISELAIATLTGTESVPLEQSGTTKRAEAQDIADLYNGGTVASDFTVQGTHLSLGADIITNGSFTSNANGWTISGADIAWAAGAIAFTNAASGEYILQTLSNTAGVYQASVTVSGLTSGAVAVQGMLNSEFISMNLDANGTYTCIGYLPANAGIYVIASDFESTTCVVDTVKLQPVQDAAHLTVHGYDGDVSLIAGNWYNGNVNVGRLALSGITDGYGNTAIGNGALASLTDGYSNVGVGVFAGDEIVSDANCVVIGAYSDAFGSNCVSIGSYVTASDNSVAIGYFAETGEASGVAIGQHAFSNELGAIAIGYFSVSSGAFSTAIGYSAEATAVGALALGFDSVVSGQNSIGIAADVTASYTAVIGTESLDETQLYGRIQLAQVVAAPGVADTARAYLFIEDNGSGKTRLMVQFPSGSAIQLAIEP